MCMKNMVLVSLVFSVFFICGSAAGQAEKVTCSGKVLDAQSKPVAGAKVAAYEMVFDGIAGNFALRKAGEVVTADDGAFIFISDPKPEKSTFYNCKVVAVKDNLSLGWTVWSMREDAELNIQLDKAQSLDGVVVDEAGEPIDGVNVYANLMMGIRTNTGEEKKDWLPGIEPMMCLGTRTDNQGRFVFNNLPENAEVGLLIKAPGLATTYIAESQPDTASPIRTGQTDVKITVAKEGRISGRILDPDTDKGVAGLKFAVVYTASGLFYYRFVCAADDSGVFSLGGLLGGEYIIRGSTRNSLQSVSVNVVSGKTKKVTVSANKPYYGRIIFEDGSPIVIKPEPWPGATTSIRGMGEGDIRNIIIYDIDDKGYFKIYLSQGQYQLFKSRKNWFMVSFPYIDKKTNMVEDVFADNLLSTNKSKAGVARIPKPKGEPESLVGKSLPELKMFHLDLSQESTQDKRILVCLFDMNQRPSRRCISRLNEQIRQLTDKGIAVVGIQAVKVENTTFDDWIKSSSISFPVGLISTNIEEVKFDWGVRSLPWLILTDTEHIVTAEGFGIDELDEKLPQANAEDDVIKADIPAYSYAAEQTTEFEPLKSFLDAQTIFDKWEANYGHIVSMKFRAFQKLIHSENAKFNYVRFSHFEKIIDGERFYVRETTSKDGFEDKESIMIKSFDGDTGKRYTAKLKTGEVGRGLLGASPESGYPVTEYLNLDVIEITPEIAAAKWGESDNEIMMIFQKKFPEGVPRFAYDFITGDKSGEVKVLPELEPVAGKMCHVLEISSSPDINVKYWFAHELGMLTMKYIVNYENGGYVKKDVLKVASVEIDMGRFWYPSEITREIKNRDEVTKYQLSIYEFVPNIKVAPETFDIDFPDGTKIYNRPIMNPDGSVSWMGNRLADISGLVLDRLLEQAKDKMVLICFVDIQQRPSRNFLLQLSKKKQELEEKDIVIEVIHASQMEQAELDKWVRDNGLPFSIGAVWGDVEIMQHGWGIKSLPWMILSDRNHIVTAEGIALDELDAIK